MSEISPYGITQNADADLMTANAMVGGRTAPVIGNAVVGSAAMFSTAPYVPPKPPRPRCTAFSARTQQQCVAHPVGGTELCVFHTPGGVDIGEKRELTKCAAISRMSGQPCKRWAIIDSTYCVVHDDGPNGRGERYDPPEAS